MELSKKQLEIVRATEDKIVVIASAAAGKAQPNDTIIPTPNGYKTMGELKPGDKVFNRFGKAETILQIFPQGKKQVYIVTFADGRKTECCGEHLWSYNNGRGGFTTKELSKMYNDGWVTKDNRGHNSYKYRVPVLRIPAEYPRKNFDIDPYIIGAFIGDGCCTEKGLTFSSNDEFIVNKISNICNFDYKKRSENNYSWDFYKDEKRIKTKDFFSNYKEELCCRCTQKRIPKEYLLGDTEQRIQLLQGLMDTDGTTRDGGNSPSYATNSKQLADDVLELIRSLGFYGQIFIQDRRDCGKGIEYTVNIFCGNENAYRIFSLPRKVEKALSFKNKKQRTNHKFDSIVNIEKTDEYKEMTCILVDDNEHLYLTNNFVVTHNTAVLTERIRYLINNGVNPKELVAITFTNLAAEEIRERVGEIAKDCFIGTVHSYCNYLLLSAGVETRDLLDEEQFDELFGKIKEHPECIKFVDHLLLDEAQDSNYAQFEFLLDSVHPKHYMLVGDHRQCQPEGTKILLFDGTEKNIENLSVGDKVISYDSYKGRIAGGAANNSKNGIVSQISKRYVENEELITITTDDGKTSKYTKNHICITNLCKYDKYNFLVYLMCDKNNRFRVGTSQLKNTRTCPWRTKMIDEGCEQIWILDTFMTNKEARVLEDKISYLYSIPQVTFQLDKTSYTQDDLDYIYDGLNTYESAKKCLNDFHRDIRYPFSRKGDNIHYAGNAFNKCYACNILPHNMTIMEFCKESHHRKKTSCIKNLYYENYTGYIYSLDIEKYHSYIADGIVTHNCIYRFNSSDPQALIELTKQPDVKVYDLNENYRNGIKILDYAKTLIRQNGYDYIDKSIPMKKTDGKVVTVEYSPNAIARGIKKVGNYKNWFILSRWNKDIPEIACACEREGVPYAIIRKKDFSSNEELKQKMAENTVKIMTIHASKGLEADNVVVIGATFNKRGNSEKVEENLCVNYVAATRAKELLVWTYAHQYRKDSIRNWE